jgi:hypothetical protein
MFVNVFVKNEKGAFDANQKPLRGPDQINNTVVIDLYYRVIVL